MPLPRQRPEASCSFTSACGCSFPGVARTPFSLGKGTGQDKANPRTSPCPTLNSGQSPSQPRGPDPPPLSSSEAWLDEAGVGHSA